MKIVRSSIALAALLAAGVAFVAPPRAMAADEMASDATKATDAMKGGATKAADTATSVPALTATTGVAAALPAENFKTIFDGKTLDGWGQFPADSWEIKDGALASNGGNRGVLYSKDDYENFRVVFKMRHVSGNHQACFLFFCVRPPEGADAAWHKVKGQDALGGIQFQVPNGGTWDYRLGRNDGGKKKGSDGPSEFTKVTKVKFDPAEWSQVEILVNGKDGTARMAVAQPVGTKAVEVLSFSDPAAARKGPIAFQIHNAKLFDEFKDVMIEADPKSDELLTTK